MAEIKLFNKKHYFYQEDLRNVLSISGIEEIKGKSFLITGATGLIGLCLIDALMLYNYQESADIKIFAVGRNKINAHNRLGEYFNDVNFHFIEQDVRSPFPSDLDVDYIIPLASNTHPMAYSQYPIETIEINVKGVENALNKAVDCGAMLLYPSTVEVYGNARGTDVFTEEYTGILNLSTSRSCYTESKRLGEALCQSYIAEKGLNIKIARLSRVFGPTMLMNDTKASSQFILNAINRKDIVLKSKGDQYYSYTYVADAVAALLFILIHGKVGEAYNVANDLCNVHLKDFAQTCADVTGTKIVFVLPSSAELAGFSIATQAILSIKKLNDLGFFPCYTFADAIKRTILMNLN